MDKNKFKDLIEAPANYDKRYTKEDVSAHMSYGNAKKIFLKALIGRTVRITLQYPELAQEYLDSLPKVINYSEQPTIS